VILAFISSQVRAKGPGELLIGLSDSEFAESGLRVASLIRRDRLVTLSDGLLLRRLGRVGPRTQSGVDAALPHVLSL
jgi:hypothetical protein